MNYGELRTQFVSLLNRRDLTPSLRDTFIQQGLARIQRSLRVPAMERSIEVTWGASTTALPIPDDLLELKSISTAFGVLNQRDVETVLVAARGIGTPTVFARRGGAWVFGPSPPGGTKLRIDYYAEVGALSEDADTNFLTTVAPDLVLSAALVFGCSWALDERKASFEEDFRLAFADLQNQALRDELTAGASVSPCYAFPDD